MVSPEINYAVAELGRTRITLRRDLVFRSQTFAGQRCYIIEDPLNSKFYRAGLTEYAFISLLDGKTSITEALRLMASSAPGFAFSEQDAAVICSWLIEAELASTAESSSPNRLRQAATAAQRSRFWQRCNPITVRVPLMRPDRLFDALAPRLGWLYTWPVFAAWSLLLLLAGSQVAANWDSFIASAAGVLVLDNWLWLGLCWVLLKFVHELSHGVVCKRYGGEVREAGLLLILLAPIAYVDVTSSWRFRSKWQRMHTAAAGVYLELLLAAVAVLLWSTTGPGLVNHVCFNVAIMASATSLIFNVNPLMRFDGYYLLSDWLEIPNLYSVGQSYLRYLGRKYLLGATASAPSWSAGRGVFIPLYALATLVWRIVVCASLIVAATTWYHGAGMVLAVAAIVAWCGAQRPALGGPLCKGGLGKDRVARDSRPLAPSRPSWLSSCRGLEPVERLRSSSIRPSLWFEPVARASSARSAYTTVSW